MCANYKPTSRELVQHHFDAAVIGPAWSDDIYPGAMAPVIRLRQEDFRRDTRVCESAMFGLVPHWGELKLARGTYNARSETVAEKPSFREAWQRGQFCIIPADALYEPCYESGKAVRWEIAASDGAPLGVAGLWETKPGGPDGHPLLSFTMLTINADAHPVFKRMHKPGEEKRMVALLRPAQYGEWLDCAPAAAPAFLAHYPAEELRAQAKPLRAPEPSPQASLF